MVGAPYLKFSADLKSPMKSFDKGVGGPYLKIFRWLQICNKTFVGGGRRRAPLNWRSGGLPVAALLLLPPSILLSGQNTEKQNGSYPEQIAEPAWHARMPSKTMFLGCHYRTSSARHIPAIVLLYPVPIFYRYPEWEDLLYTCYIPTEYTILISNKSSFSSAKSFWLMSVTELWIVKLASWYFASSQV